MFRIYQQFVFFLHISFSEEAIKLIHTIHSKYNRKDTANNFYDFLKISKNFQ